MDKNGEVRQKIQKPFSEMAQKVYEHMKSDNKLFQFYQRFMSAQKPILCASMSETLRDFSLPEFFGGLILF